MLDVLSGASLFNADIELRKILLATERKPVPFVTIMNFGLHLQVDTSPFPVASESSLNSENPK